MTMKSHAYSPLSYNVGARETPFLTTVIDEKMMTTQTNILCRCTHLFFFCFFCSNIKNDTYSSFEGLQLLPNHNAPL